MLFCCFVFSFFFFFLFLFFFFFFFFSSRRRHTRLTCDWSSDVCSSDLVLDAPVEGGIDQGILEQAEVGLDEAVVVAPDGGQAARRQRRQHADDRSEERRVGKECRSRWSP